MPFLRIFIRLEKRKQRRFELATHRFRIITEHTDEHKRSIKLKQDEPLSVQVFLELKAPGDLNDLVATTYTNEELPAEMTGREWLCPLRCIKKEHRFALERVDALPDKAKIIERTITKKYIENHAKISEKVPLKKRSPPKKRDKKPKKKKSAKNPPK